MKKTEKTLLTILVAIAVVGGIVLSFQALANPAPTEEELALTEAGATYGEEGHTEMKSLLKTVANSLSGEVDLSGDAQKYLFGEPRGCVLDSKSGLLGGQWFISSWITAPNGDLEKLRDELQAENTNLIGDLIKDENSLTLSSSTQERVTAKKLDSDTFEVTLTSKCYGEN